ncbi:hypothetical protein SCP_1800480 [Sparassis crispa]|uniref:Uncharacterized protein n=1 Tax=Sparassis crispa TaxID=139825 RepID=A0A401H6F8_9APHY|nr:hypothetical protein SCP_1800480 [Sparassis crispa]GBE90026.1 hypothetical protein SCP_1800480 [Sparassis crispa]
MKAALPERNDQVFAFAELNNAMAQEDRDVWRAALETWEKDPSKLNPFVATRPTITQAAVHLQLANEEAAELEKGEQCGMLHELVSPSVMILARIELQEQQYRLGQDTAGLGAHSTDLQRAKIIEQRNGLHHKIEALAEIQQLYMPSTVTLRARAVATAVKEVLAQDMVLYLPSELPSGTLCDPRVQRYELRLRTAQAYDALDELRRHLRVRAHLYKFKDHFVHGQRYLTRAKMVIARVQDKINADAAHYCRAYSAINSLATLLHEPLMPNDLGPLQGEDVHGMTDGMLGETQSWKTLSWIWRRHGVGSSSAMDNTIHEELHVEWCNAHARAYRWMEECRQLPEEMCRVISFHGWIARWWLKLIDTIPARSHEHLEGAIAYAYHQADIRLSMRKHCRSVWRCVPAWLQAGGDISVDADSVEPTIQEPPPMNDSASTSAGLSTSVPTPAH